MPPSSGIGPTDKTLTHLVGSYCGFRASAGERCAQTPLGVVEDLLGVHAGVEGFLIVRLQFRGECLQLRIDILGGFHGSRGLLAIAAMALIIHSMATPVHGIGIAVPVFVPVVATAILAFILSREYAAPLAYIGGSMGTLIGADLLNLDRIGSLGAPVASIGGAGTFDGIFLTGILAVLLAGIASPSRPRPAW